MAMIGSSAYAGAVTHTLSSSVMVFELAGNSSYALHVMLATAISFSISRMLSSSVFERIIRVRGLPYISDLRYLPRAAHARGIMSGKIVPGLFSQICCFYVSYNHFYVLFLLQFHKD